jgi:hypothetical protein
MRVWHGVIAPGLCWCVVPSRSKNGQLLATHMDGRSGLPALRRGRRPTADQNTPADKAFEALFNFNRPAAICQTSESGSRLPTTEMRFPRPDSVIRIVLLWFRLRQDAFFAGELAHPLADQSLWSSCIFWNAACRLRRFAGTEQG